MSWKKLLESVSESLNDDIQLRNEYLLAENRILRDQIDGRVQLTNSNRKELAELGAKVGKKALGEIATVAKPDTILAWNRKFAKPKVDNSESSRAVGRPRVDQEIEDLVIRMAWENRSWGYDRIQGALNHLGYKISDQTVGNIFKRNGISPAPERKKTVTWREFVRSHMDVLLATDFFHSDIWSRCGVAIFCLIGCLNKGWRQIRCVGATLYRDVQQLRVMMLHSLDECVHRQRWSPWGNSIKVFARSRTMRFSQGGPGDGMALMPDKKQKARSPDLSQVVLLSAQRFRQRRDSPTPHQQTLQRWLNDSGREAA